MGSKSYESESFSGDRTRDGGMTKKWFFPKTKTRHGTLSCPIEIYKCCGILYILLLGFIKKWHRTHSSVHVYCNAIKPMLINNQSWNMKLKKKEKRDACIHGDVCRETIGIHYQSWAAEPRAFIDRPGRSFITTDGVWEKEREKCCNVFVGRCDAWLIMRIRHHCNVGLININASPNSHDIRVFNRT